MGKYRTAIRTSLPEKTILFYIQRYFSDAQYNIRPKELDSLELDIFIPSLKIAIEYDGNAWHKNPNKDCKKDTLCFKNGIHLIRVREFGLPIYQTNAVLIQAKRADKKMHFLKPIIQSIFDMINSLCNLEIKPDIEIDDDYSSILELVEKIEYEGSLAYREPEIAKEWDCVKNKSLKPEDVAASAGRSVWWICEKGHSYRAPVYSRKKCGCPICANKKVLKGYNDLATLKPDLVKEWDYSKNNILPNSITIGTSRRVWWICEHGHSWKTSVANRTNKDNLNKCPFCSGKKPIKGETDLETLAPEIAKQWNYEKNGDLNPSDFMVSSKAKVWWICEKGHEWEAYIYQRHKSGCPICSNKKVLKGYNDLETINPVLSKEWNFTKNGDLKPSDIVCGSNKKVWWKCSICGYEWESTPSNRHYSHHGCPACTHQVVRRKVEGASQYDSIGRPMYNDLETVRPDLALQWDYERNGDLKPSDVNVGADRKVWWVCEKGHHYEATVYQRATKDVGKGTNCPICANKKVLKGYNDLATLNPIVAAEWDYERNGDLKPSDFVVSSGKRVWWKCSTCGYEWEASIVNRSSKHNQTKCPVCTHQKVVPGINDLATQYPQLLEEWDYSKNTLNPHEISGGTNKKAWWICKECGNSWETSIPVRTKMNGGCPKCSAIRRGKLRSINARKPILQYSLDGGFIKEWPSSIEASQALNCSATNIRECANKKRKSANGFMWRYK
ncbi:MAG: hypothetical protein E7175_00595 [Erysipelotrichaceae bacterium]|nr:hypothetical protein [Erysipelotrichaceae bacterium]